MLSRKSLTPRVSGGGLGHSYRSGNKTVPFLQKLFSRWLWLHTKNSRRVLLTLPVQVRTGSLSLGRRRLPGLGAHRGRRRLRPGDAPGPLQGGARGYQRSGGRGEAGQPRRPGISLPGISHNLQAIFMIDLN